MSTDAATQTSESTATDAVSLILKQAGRSADEVAALSTLDEADRSAEGQFSGEAPTLASLYGSARAVEFDAGQFRPAAEVADVMQRCLEFALERKRAGTLLDHQQMLFASETISGLAERGFFGLAIPKAFGGSGARLGDLGPLLRALTFVHPDLAVMFEVHNFLGPVTPILDFGTEAQQQEYLPRMARGELMGSFALTEPGVGADPSRLATTARREGNTYLLDGVKWPITNVIYGGLCILVVKLKGEGLRPGRDSGMILFEVPKADSDHFQMKRNRLVAFDYLWNARFRLQQFKVPADRLLGPPGKGLAQAFSSLAKGRGGICVNSAAKSFRLLAQIILDPQETDASTASPKTEAEGTSAAGDQGGASREENATKGGWTAFRQTFGKPIGDAPRIQSWIGKATCHALASRGLGDLCFRLGANGVRDETQGMIAKVYATKALLETAIHVYQIQGGRSVHADERRAASRQGLAVAEETALNFIENYVGENMHEFTIATVYEGPNPVLADVGAPNAMTRQLRSKYLEPIGLAELQGQPGLGAKLRFGWFAARTILGSFNPWTGSLDGVEPLFPEKEKYVQNALCRNRVLGRRILLTIAEFQQSFMDEAFVLGDEGGIFDQLCASLASLVFALSLPEPQHEYLLVAAALDQEAAERVAGKAATPSLHRKWAEIGRRMMDAQSRLHQDLIADMDVSQIPLDPRLIDRYI